MIAKIDTVELNDFYLTGISVRTINNGKSQKDMRALWERFMNDDVFRQIEDRVSDDIHCAYTDYKTDHTGYYTAVLGCKVNSLAQIPEGLTGISIPGGKYYIYSLTGKCPGNVLDAWQEIWNSDVDRKYSSDFDLYKPNFKSFEDSEVQIYLAIN